MLASGTINSGVLPVDDDVLGRGGSAVQPPPNDHPEPDALVVRLQQETARDTARRIAAMTWRQRKELLRELRNAGVGFILVPLIFVADLLRRSKMAVAVATVPIVVTGMVFAVVVRPGDDEPAAPPIAGPPTSASPSLGTPSPTPEPETSSPAPEPARTLTSQPDRSARPDGDTDTAGDEPADRAVEPTTELGTEPPDEPTEQPPDAPVVPVIDERNCLIDLELPADLPPIALLCD